MAKRTSQGKCQLCGGTFDKQGISRHVEKCLQEHAQDSPKAAAEKTGKLFHLLIQGRHLPEYWLHVEVPGSAKLSTLDQFLRDIWLECCDHMSAFSVDGVTYSVAPMADFDDRNMNVRLDKVLEVGTRFGHEYDFGSTTSLALKVAGRREGKAKPTSVRLLARNEPPPIKCLCGNDATEICGQCVYGPKGWLCEQCAAAHECGDEMLLPVVNSPRTGVCGYTGD